LVLIFSVIVSTQAGNCGPLGRVFAAFAYVLAGFTSEKLTSVGFGST
jgi:hypothetical protein